MECGILQSKELTIAAKAKNKAKATEPATATALVTAGNLLKDGARHKKEAELLAHGGSPMQRQH